VVAAINTHNGNLNDLSVIETIITGLSQIYVLIPCT